MPRPFSLLLVPIAALLLPLAACNRAPSSEAPEKPAEKANTGVAAAYLPTYPGATVKAQLQSPGEKGGVIVMVTDDPVSKVAAFYDAKAKEAGIQPATFTTDEDSVVRIFGDSASASGGLLAISRRDDAAGSEIVITFGRAGPSERRERQVDSVPMSEPLR